MKVGILGAGQLGRMLALSGIPLNVDFVLFDRAPDACGRSLGEFINAAFEDQSRLQELAAKVDVITVEFENIPASSLAWLNERVCVCPAPNVVATAQDRLLEKQLFAQLGIPSADYEAIDQAQDFIDYCSAKSQPLIAKSRREGYDGKGQVRIKTGSDLEAAWKELGGIPVIVEDKIDFDREISIIGIRAQSGDTAFYPISENLHADGILRYTKVRLNDAMQQQAEDFSKRVMDELDVIGALTFEFFNCGDQLIANEIAPRVHNSGHWTIEGADSSQFENHIRAICGLPLGSTETRGPSAMFNLIGELPSRDAVLAIEGAHWHDYGKQPRPGRKLGHITLRANDSQQFEQRLEKLERVLGRISD